MSQEEQLQQTRRKIFDELTKIVDPEIGVSIMELELVDNVDINTGKVNVDLHLTSPFCPAVLASRLLKTSETTSTRCRVSTKSRSTSVTTSWLMR